MTRRIRKTGKSSKGRYSSATAWLVGVLLAALILALIFFLELLVGPFGLLAAPVILMVVVLMLIRDTTND